MSPMTVAEREALVRDLIENWGLDEISARFAIALRHGDVSGCIVDSEQPRAQWVDGSEEREDSGEA